MRIRCVSDLHFEFQRDHGKELMADIVKDDAFDVLVVAGDLADRERLEEALILVAESTKKDIVYVPGNHEYYGGSFSEVQELLQYMQGRKRYSGMQHMHILEQSEVTIQGQRFVGCTLWYPHPKPLDMDEGMGDFTYIFAKGNEIHERALASADYLDKTVKAGDIVVTHFLPHPRSIRPEYKGSPLNRYFLHNISDVVENREARLWIHGHTHGTLDYRASRTRVVCNPFGYAKGSPTEPNPKFNTRFTVEV